MSGTNTNTKRNQEFNDITDTLNIESIMKNFDADVESKFSFKSNTEKLFKVGNQKIRQICSKPIEIIKNTSDITEENITNGIMPNPLPGKEQEFVMAKDELVNCQKPIIDLLKEFNYSSTIENSFSRTTFQLCLDDCEKSFLSNKNKDETKSCTKSCLQILKQNYYTMGNDLGKHSEKLIDIINTRF